MKRYLLLFTLLLVGASAAWAEGFSRPLSELDLTLDLAEPTLTDPATASTLAAWDAMLLADTLAADSEAARKAAYRAKYGGYTPLGELEVTTIPLIAFGFIAKGNKKDFRAARNNFIPSYENRMDDYIQFAPAWVALGMNICGYKGRSDFKRLFFSAGFSYAFMGAFVNGIKYTAKEMRPDGSTANSFPSGHTATSFVSATIMHKEYGLTRSPWWSVGAYSVATLTGIMRTLNNRHWISDVLVGAGIGVISTDLGYMMADFWMKDKGIKNPVKEGNYDLTRGASFFKLSLGTSMISNITLPSEGEFTRYDWLSLRPGAPAIDTELIPVATHGDPLEGIGGKLANHRTIRVGTATSVGAEAAYFINRYVGVGARARISTAPIMAEGLEVNTEINGKTFSGTGSASDVLAVTDWAAGLYGSLPFTSRFALGAKALYGRRYTGNIELAGVTDVPYTLKDYETGQENQTTLTFYGDALNLSGRAADQLSAGISATYAMGNGVALSIFYDYDFSRVTYDAEYWPDSNDVTQWSEGARKFTFRQRTHTNTLGASMTVMF